MDMSSLFSAFSLVAVFIYIYIGFYTYRQNKRSNIHIAFLSLCMSYAIWSLAYSLAYVSTSKYVFSFWNKISAIGWCSFSAISLFLVLLITENRILQKRLIKFLIFLPSFLFFFMAVFLFGAGVKTSPIISEIFYIGDFLYNFVFLLTSIIILFVWGLRSDSTRIKKQSKILVISSTIPFGLNLLTQTIFPIFGINQLPLMGQLYSVIMIIGTYIVITKYKFLRLPEKFILEEVSKEILDMVIIIDEKGQIIRISQYTLNMMGFEENELLKQNIDNIIGGSINENFSLDLIKQRDMKYNDITLFKKNGERIPVNISCKQIFDSKVHDLLGIILVIQDISLFYELQNKNEELKEYVRQITTAEEELRFRYNQNIENEKKLSISEEKFRTIFEQAPLGITLQDSITGRLLEVNSKFAEITGRTVEQLINLDLLDITHPEDIQKSIENVSLLRNNKAKSRSINKRYIKPNGDIVWVNLKIVSVSYGDRTTPCEICMIEDITEQKRMEKLIFSENERFKTTLLSVGDGVISTDRQGNIELINKVGEQLTGWTQMEAWGKPLEKVFNIVNEFTEKPCENPVLKVLESGKTIEIDNSTILISNDGTRRPIEDSAAPIKDENGNISGVVLVFRDFTERKERQTQIEYLSYHDQLTGLYNRRFFEEELKRLDVERNFPLTIVMADVNGLKLINDSFGHALGDELLKKVAEVMKNGCRADDIIARLGGDEFVILLPKTDIYEAELITKRIKALALKEKVCSIDISVSFGYEIKRHENEKVLETLKKAEDLMYKKKLFESPSMRGKTIQAIISTLHEKNKREEQHSQRVSELCKSMALVLGLPEDEIEELKTVGLLHDIGKIAIEENILNKPGKLSDDEWEEIMRHPEIGYRILSTVHDMAEMADYTLSHHERWDGTGYPKQLKGKEIPLQSRIIAIADAFDAMTSERSYRDALSKEIAVEELQKNAGIQFDPELVRVFIEKVLSTDK